MGRCGKAATGLTFAFAQMDTMSVDWIGQTDQNAVYLEAYVYNPTDPAHTNGGYNTVPDATVCYTYEAIDGTLSFSLSRNDLTCINSLQNKVVTVVIKAYSPGAPAVRLRADKLTFTGASLSTPMQAVAQPKQQYFDPGVTNPELATVQSKMGYLMRLYDVQSGLLLVNWAYAPAAATSIRVYRGFVLDNNGGTVPPGPISKLPGGGQNDLVTQFNSKANAVSSHTMPKMLDPGVYTIVFWNGSGKAINTSPFAASADYGDTWTWASAFRDYLVSATAGGVTVKSVIRAAPGRSEPPALPWDGTPSWVPSTVTIQSWEPQ